MSAEATHKVKISPEEKRERRKQQLRESQRRFYNTHKKKEQADPPVSYNPEYLRNYHKTYYQANKEKIINRARLHYHELKASKTDELPTSCGARFPLKGLPSFFGKEDGNRV